MGGGKGGGGGVGTDPYALQQSVMAQGIFNETTPLRQSLTNQLSQFASGAGGFDPAAYLRENPDVAAQGIDPWQHYLNYGRNEGRPMPTTGGGAFPSLFNPVYNAGRSAIENQYNVAKENLIGASPKGGSVADALASLEASRVSDLTNLEAGITNDLYNKAYATAFNTPQVSIAGMSGPSNTYATQLAANTAANAQQQSAKYGMLGNMGVGAGVGLGRKAGTAAAAGDTISVPIEYSWAHRNSLRPE